MADRRRALPPRLAAVAALVPRGARVADVGTDAGLLALGLLDSGRADYCVASDRAAAGLDIAARRGVPYLAAGRLHLRHGDGLDVLSRADAVDVVVVAGLGARSIERILVPDRLERLGVRRVVVQPQTDPRRVRRWLCSAGLGIVAERLARERGRDYVAIAATRGAAAARAWRPTLPDDDLLDAGPFLVASGDPLVRAHWQRELRRLDRVLDRARGGARRGAAARRRLALRVLARLSGSARSV
ncbi:MAG TPA: tRNA (adenine(22)-N(1))-methyltransferase TrmK [Candidatus Polarisedimenticolaceae bacterium]|nr:tRNA (adenine(22)-N(1))-methyltransferase TrmK [Candidatus Polarisedimenticolaceae bacterium]